MEEGTSYGTPALRIRGKFFVRLKEDGDSLVVRVDFDERDALMKLDPDVYYITGHYRDYPAVLVRLSKIEAKELQSVLEQAWCAIAPKRLVPLYTDTGRNDAGRRSRSKGKSVRDHDDGHGPGAKSRSKSKSKSKSRFRSRSRSSPR